jgi:hypothetical protein
MPNPGNTKNNHHYRGQNPRYIEIQLAMKIYRKHLAKSLKTWSWTRFITKRKHLANVANHLNDRRIS